MITFPASTAPTTVAWCSVIDGFAASSGTYNMTVTCPTGALQLTYLTLSCTGATQTVTGKLCAPLLASQLAAANCQRCDPLHHCS